MYTDKHINSFSHKVCTISYEQFLIGIKLGLRDPVYEQTQKIVSRQQEKKRFYLPKLSSSRARSQDVRMTAKISTKLVAAQD
jgi:hypothetical protein